MDLTFQPIRNGDTTQIKLFANENEKMYGYPFIYTLR